MRRERKPGGSAPAAPWQRRRRAEETYAFVVRIRFTITADGTPTRPRFGLEEVATSRSDQFANYALMAERLSIRVQEILSGPAHDEAQH